MDPVPIAELLANYGGWGLSVVLMGTVGFLYRQLSAQYRKQLERSEHVIENLTATLTRLAEKEKH